MTRDNLAQRDALFKNRLHSIGRNALTPQDHFQPDSRFIQFFQNDSKFVDEIHCTLGRTGFCVVWRTGGSGSQKLPGNMRTFGAPRQALTQFHYTDRKPHEPCLNIITFGHLSFSLFYHYEVVDFFPTH